MEKIFTMLVAENEVEKMENSLKKHDEKVKDYQKSKTFSVQGLNVIAYILVTDEETFTEITKDLDGTRMY